MSKFVKIRWPDSGSDADTVTSRRNWQKSFPANTVRGRDWIVDVLDDLANFADHEGIDQIGSELRDVKSRVANMLHPGDLRRRRGAGSDGER